MHPRQNTQIIFCKLFEKTLGKPKFKKIVEKGKHGIVAVIITSLRIFRRRKLQTCRGYGEEKIF